MESQSPSGMGKHPHERASMRSYRPSRMKRFCTRRVELVQYGVLEFWCTNRRFITYKGIDQISKPIENIVERKKKNIVNSLPLTPFILFTRQTFNLD